MTGPATAGGAVPLVVASTVALALLAAGIWGRRRGIGTWRAVVVVLFGLYLALVLALTGERPGGAHGGLRRDRPQTFSQPAGRPEKGRTRDRRKGVMPS
jgi:hypothetical protein